MPFKRKRSPYFQVRRKRLPGYGDTGQISSGTTNKDVAVRMEEMLEELADAALLRPSMRELLDRICRHEVSLADALSARNRGHLDEMVSNLVDPVLADAVRDYSEMVDPDRTTRMGFAMIIDHAPAGSRLSYLRVAKHVTSMLHAAEAEGRKRNTVRRTMMRAMRSLLRHHVGTSAMQDVFHDVTFASENDAREEYLTAKEIGRLLEACECKGRTELATIIQTALLTSADRGVLLAGNKPVGYSRGLLVRDVQVFYDTTEDRYSGTIYLHDTKTETRSRTLPITDLLCRQLIRCCHGKQPDDPVFDLSYYGLDYVWKEVRVAAGLTHITFKDLRHTTAVHAEQSGMPLTVAARGLGHRDETMTRRYQKHRAVVSLEQIAAMQSSMGLQKVV